MGNKVERKSNIMAVRYWMLVLVIFINTSMFPMVQSDSITSSIESVSTSTAIRDYMIGNYHRKNHHKMSNFGQSTNDEHNYYSTSSTSAPEQKYRPSTGKTFDLNDFTSFHLDLTHQMDGITKLIENSFQQTMERIGQLETTVNNLKQRLEEQENGFVIGILNFKF